MKSLKKKLIKGVIALTLMTVLVIPTFASEARDFDSNAVIYGGAFSLTELNDRLVNGSGPNVGAGVYGNWQTPNGVRTFYNGIGIYESQFGNLVDGIVKRDGTVWVDGVHKASTVFSSGRVDIAPSTLQNYGPIPIYWREPKYSFAQDSLPAFVYLNYDGSFAYAIVKSCGNPITPNTLKAKIKIPPIIPPVVAETFDITVRKFNDLDGDSTKDDGEPMLSGWQFKIEGDGVEVFGVTDSNGEIAFKDLLQGNYTITETLIENWRSTTLNPITITLSDVNLIVWFGNTRIPEIPVPVTPQGEEEIIKGAFTEGGEVKGAFTGSLPQAGGETAAALGITSLGSGAYYWLRSKKLLLAALKK